MRTWTDIILSVLIRPLPDERPRASVANLIGRFEQQNKRHSLTAGSTGSPSRSSSVVSNITGDSAKEEIKERREWPPKPATAAADNNSPLAPPAPIYASAFWSKPKPTTVNPPSNSTSDPANSSNNVSTLSTTKSEPEPTVKDTVAVEPPTSPTPKPPVPAAAQQSPRSAKTAPRTTGRPAARTSMAPVKPQHTGQSISSPKPKVTPSTPKSSTPRPSSVPRTPASIRPKTPSSATAGRPKTPATHANRPKTPNSSTPGGRPKTPSSGLFAPTAASLARARNAQPQPPAPTRKVTLSTAAAERLSKPTAASLSKARSAGPIATGPIKTASTAKAGPTAAKGGAKPKSGIAHPIKAAKSAAPTIREPATNGNGKPAHESGVVSAEDSHYTDEQLEKHQEDVKEEGHSVVQGSNQEDVVEEVHLDAEQPNREEVEEVNEEVHEQEEQVDEVDEVHLEVPHSEGSPVPEAVAESREVESSEEPVPPEHGPDTHSEGSPVPSTDPRADLALEQNASAAGEEYIEHLVEFLENDKPRPISVTVIPDELDVHEIPDEE
ncbi:hypothetical protein EV361DRAFT_948619 [Lentinula raphanica]|nr:hypothetical protein F5880DRAFT_1609762 [Lentinula raphanica]KAJ3972666.1 hypothetical protein EV361DRAFT_948619 [Lentinula raphanica]